MTTLDQTTQQHAHDLNNAIETAVAAASTFGASAAIGWLSDYVEGVGGLSSFRAGVLAAMDMELATVNAERADLANELAVLRDHVKELESGTRDALAIDWDSLRDAVAAIPGIPAPAIAAVMAAFHKAVTP